ncbi:MAG: DUF1996 domain-containing protein [Granulosicoccus sp.]
MLLLPALGNAFADCTDTYLLPDNQWHQISLPCAAPADASSAGAILGDDMGENAVYGENWNLYAYNPGSNTYTDIGFDGQMVPGMGYWIFNGTGSNRLLSMPSGSQPVTPINSPECPAATSNCIATPLNYSAERAGEAQYNMIGIASPNAYRWGDLRVADALTCDASHNSNATCTLAEANTSNIFQSTAWQFSGTQYTTITSSTLVSTWSAMWVLILPNAQPDSELRLLLPAETADNTMHRITVGTQRKTEMDTSSSTVAEQAHGTRVYCTVSHFSSDDPIVHPAQPSAAHLHMFWGNTQTDADSTANSLLSSGNASCEGGVNNKSAYWAPALFNDQDEVVLPESIFVYYKSFSHTAGFDRNTIMPIPDGLQMLANQQVPNSGPWNFRVDPDLINGNQHIRLSIAFPMCLQIDGNGLPTLSAEDNVSHLSYSVASRETSSDCPASHPYRIPQLIYTISYDVPFNSQWYLASDHHAQVQGSSLHADYFAAWDEQTMDRIVLCNRESKGSCEFAGQENGQRVLRTQLPERFLSPEGIPLYSDSTTLLPETDRTPFGTLLQK